MNFENDVYDVINSPFLVQIQQLPTVEYYNVDYGFKEIDLISSEKYGEPFFAYLIQFYNNDFRTNVNSFFQKSCILSKIVIK